MEPPPLSLSLSLSLSLNQTNKQNVKHYIINEKSEMKNPHSPVNSAAKPDVNFNMYSP